MLKGEERYAHVEDLSRVEREFCGESGSWEEMRGLVLSLKERVTALEDILTTLLAKMENRVNRLVNVLASRGVLPPPS
jgi:hypothetical protein